MLFHRIGERPEKDEETQSRVEPADIVDKTQRADAVYFALSNSEAQRSLILKVADISLKDRPKELASLKALMKSTRGLAKVRNSIVHAYYDQFFVLKGSKFILEPLEMKSMSQLRPKQDVDLVQAAKDFKELSNKLLLLWSQIFEGE